MRAVDKSVTLGYKWATESEGEQMPNMGDVCGTCGKLFDLHRAASPHHCPSAFGGYRNCVFTPDSQEIKFKVGDRVAISRQSTKPDSDSTKGAFPRHFDRSQGIIIRIPGLFGECSVELMELNGTRKDSFSCDFAQLDKLPDSASASATSYAVRGEFYPDKLPDADLAFFSRCTSPGACEKCAGPKPCAYHG